MRLATLAVLSAGLIAFAPLAHADASVDKRLDERGIKYKVDDDGDYRVVYNYEKESRTQLVFIGGGTETTGAFTVREVFSPAADISKNGIDRAKLVDVLRDSRTNKLGSWELDGNVLLYVIKLPDDVSAAGLEAAMDMAGTIADDMEIKLSGGKDDF